MEKPKVLTSEILFQGYFNVCQDLIERSDGRRASYSHCILPTDAAVVIAQTPDQRYILNREYRHPTGQYLIGWPGGGLYPNEDPLIGGMREFCEETGYWSEEVSLLGAVYALPAICSQKITFLYAKNAHLKGDQTLDPFEFIQTELWTEGQLNAYLKSSPVLDGLLLTALSLLRSKA